jgi:hypothetical protein
MSDVEPAVMARWERHMLHFVRALTLAHGKALVLKSPTHTGRIGVLSRLFPGARFIHVVRHPEPMFASTRRLWETLDWFHGMQMPHRHDADEYVLRCFERMYRGYESQRREIAPHQLCEIRYEDLVRDPPGAVERIYRRLELGDFAQVRSHIEAYLREQRDYRPNAHAELDPRIREQIRRRWGGYLLRYGYELSAGNGQ